MTSRDFCYWLQGFFELTGGDGALSGKQSALVRKHLALVFIHEIDPSAGDEREQKKLNDVHAPSREFTDEDIQAIRKEVEKFMPPYRPGGTLARC